MFSEIKRLKSIDKQFKNALTGYSFDVAHFNCSCSCFGTIRDYKYVKLMIRKHIPYIVQFHCDLEYQINKWPCFLRRIALKKLKKIIFHSSKTLVLNYNSLNYVKRMGVEGYILPNFIDIKPISSRLERVINSNIQKIIFVGHVTPEKGFKEIVETAKNLREITFVIVGKAEQQVIDSIANEENIEILGIKSHEEVLKLLYEADLFLLPSYSEGFSIALLEAMSTGIPCVVSNVGANKEMIEDKGGIVLQHICSKEIIDSIHLLDKESVRLSMGKWNIDKVISYYSTDSVLNRLNNYYQDICRIKR